MLFAALMVVDVAIEFCRGVPMGLQTFELLIFPSALVGISFHWRMMIGERRRSGRHRGLVAVWKAGMSPGAAPSTALGADQILGDRGGSGLLDFFLFRARS